MVYYLRAALDVELTRKGGVHMNSLAMIDLKQFIAKMEDLETRIKEQSTAVVSESESTKFSLVLTALKKKVLSQFYKKDEGVELDFKFF